MDSLNVGEIKSLPMELWVEIISNFLELVGMRKAVRLRLVNKMFAGQVINAICRSYLHYREGSVRQELSRRAKYGLPIPARIMGALLLAEMEHNPRHDHLFPIWEEIQRLEKNSLHGIEERLQIRRIICEAVAERQFWTWKAYRLGFRCSIHLAGYVQLRNPAMDDKAAAQISLCAAIVSCDFLRVNELLAKGADANAPNEYFGRPLQLAAKWSNVAIVERLLDAGADVHASQTISAQVFRFFDWPYGLYNSSCGSAFEVACFAGQKTIVRLFVQQRSRKEPFGEEFIKGLESAARGGNVEIISILMEKLYSGIIALPSDIPRRIFLIASYNGHEKVVEMMLREGVDVNTMHTKRGCPSAFQLARKRGHLRVMRLLLENGASMCLDW